MAPMLTLQLAGTESFSFSRIHVIVTQEAHDLTHGCSALFLPLFHHILASKSIDQTKACRL